MKRTIIGLLTLLLFASTTAAMPAAASAESTPTPIIDHIEHNGVYTNVVWNPMPNTVKGVNVYKNGVYKDTVAWPGTVYNDFDVRNNNVYYVVAFDHSINFSAQTTPTRAIPTGLPAVENLAAKPHPSGSGGAVISWNHGGGSVDGWEIYRNGKFWYTYPPVRHSGKITVSDVGATVNKTGVYEVRPRLFDSNQGRTIYGPKSLVAAPVLDQAARTRFLTPEPANVVGSSATSNAHAVAANQASATAVAERGEANKALGVFGAAVATATAAPSPGTAIAAVATGIWAAIETYEALEAEEIAKQKMDAYKSCMASSCAFDPPPWSPEPGTDDPPGVIPGTTTPGGCNEGGCWPA